MAKEIKYINGNKVNIISEPHVVIDDDLPDEIDFSKLKQISNPFKNDKEYVFQLEPDLAKHFKNSDALNRFIRLQLISFENVIL